MLVKALIQSAKLFQETDHTSFLKILLSILVYIPNSLPYTRNGSYGNRPQFNNKFNNKFALKFIPLFLTFAFGLLTTTAPGGRD